MRSRALLPAALLLLGCGSSREQAKPAPPPPRAPAAPAPAAAPSEADEGEGTIVLKGSKPRGDAAAPAPRDDDSQQARQARIDDLKRRAGDGSTSSWQEFSSKDGGYKVMFPAAPESFARTLRVATGTVTVQCARYAAKAPDKHVYFVTHMDVSAKDAEQLRTDKGLGAVTALSAAGVKGKLVESHSIEQSGFPGTESKIESADGTATLRTRIFVVETRVYQVGAVCPRSEDGGRDMFKFLESFAVVK